VQVLAIIFELFYIYFCLQHFVFSSCCSLKVGCLKLHFSKGTFLFLLCAFNCVFHFFHTSLKLFIIFIFYSQRLSFYTYVVFF
jgi:hypothetical protein